MRKVLFFLMMIVALYCGSKYFGRSDYNPQVVAKGVIQQKNFAVGSIRFMWKSITESTLLSVCFPTKVLGFIPKKTAWLRHLLPKIILTRALWKAKSEKTKLRQLLSIRLHAMPE